MSIKNRPYFVRADKWEDFLNHKTDDEVLERCKRIDRMINMDAPVVKNRSEDMEHREIKGETMDKQRLIDANMMAVEESEAYMSAQTSGKISSVAKEIINVIHRKIQQLITDTPTVEPETLPIVRKLREELASVTAERDAAVNDINEILSLTELCPILCEWCKWSENCDSLNTPEWRGTNKG